jgi:hypothetical protein
MYDLLAGISRPHAQMANKEIAAGPLPCRSVLRNRRDVVLRNHDITTEMCSRQQHQECRQVSRDVAVLQSVKVGHLTLLLMGSS